MLLVGARAQALGTLSQRAILGHVYLWGGHGLQIKGTFRYVLGYVVRCDDGSLIYSRDVWVNETDLVVGGFSSLGAAQQPAGMRVGTGHNSQLPTDAGAGPSSQLPDGAGPSGQLPPSPDAHLHAGMDAQEDSAEEQDSEYEEGGDSAFDLLLGTGPSSQLPGAGSFDQQPFFGTGPSSQSPPFGAGSSDQLPLYGTGSLDQSPTFGDTPSGDLPPVQHPLLSPIAAGDSDANFEVLDEDSQQTLDLTRDPLFRRDRTSRAQPQLFPVQLFPTLVATCFAVWNGQNMTVPKNYKKAMLSPEADQWRSAVVEHL